MKVDFVGHPLIDAITHRKPVDKNAFKQQHNLNNLPIIALLPGSRKQEISKMLKVMLNIVDAFPNHQFVIAGAPSQDQSFYSKFLGNRNVKLIMNQTYDLLDLSEAAIVTSGTATLETALFKVPEVVCYKSSWLSYQIGKRLVKLKFISLVNLIMNREVVKELIQNEFTPNQLQHELQQLVDTEYRSKLISDYDLLENSLGGPGASEKIAQLIADSVKQTAQ
jgi:lipid-A-disaccharide synthase